MLSDCSFIYCFLSIAVENHWEHLKVVQLCCLRESKIWFYLVSDLVYHTESGGAAHYGIWLLCTVNVEDSYTLKTSLSHWDKQKVGRKKKKRKKPLSVAPLVVFAVWERTTGHRVTGHRQTVYTIFFPEFKRLLLFVVKYAYFLFKQFFCFCKRNTEKSKKTALCCLCVYFKTKNVHLSPLDRKRELLDSGPKLWKDVWQWKLPQKEKKEVWHWG